MNVGLRLLQISAVYMVIGLSMGLAMGISSDYALSSVHAHISLLGWVTMSIAGIVYILMPGCNRNRLATLHFWGHNLGLPVMMASLALDAYGHKGADKVIAVSSTLVLASLLIFAVNLFLNGRLDRPR